MNEEAIRKAFVSAMEGVEFDISVSVGQERIEDLIANATQRANYRSGGR